MDLPDDLQAKLDEYNRNFAQIDKILGDSDLIGDSAASDLRVEKTKEVLTEALPVAVRTLVSLATTAVSESVKLKASMYLVDRALGKDTKVAEEDAATQLLRRITVKVENDTQEREEE